MSKQGIALVGLSLALLTPSQAIAAKIDAGDIKDASLVVADTGIPPVPTGGSTPGTGGGYFSCPAGTKIVTGGAYMFPTGETPKPSNALFQYVNSSSPTTDGNGWYADASNGTLDPMTMRVILRCLPQASLADVQVVLKTVSVAFDESDGAKAGCPAGSRAITGGAFWHGSGVGPEHANANDAWVGASSPTGGAGGWYANGRAFAPLELTITAHCLPSNQVTAYKARGKDYAVGGGENVVKKGSCPKSAPAAGPAGSYFHKPGDGFEDDSANDTIRLSGGVLEKPKRFFAGGRNISGNYRLATRAFCLSK